MKKQKITFGSHLFCPTYGLPAALAAAGNLTCYQAYLPAVLQAGCLERYRKFTRGLHEGARESQAIFLVYRE